MYPTGSYPGSLNIRNPVGGDGTSTSLDFPKQAPPNECSPDVYDNLMFSTSIEDFLTAKKAQDPACFIWDDDGCSHSPDNLGGFKFLPGCQRHDFGCRNAKEQGRFDSIKSRIDDQLKNDLYNACSKHKRAERFFCEKAANIYVGTVRKFGGGKNETSDEESAVLQKG